MCCATEAGNELGTMSWSEALARTVTGLRYDLVDVERSAGGLLRVTIDRLPGVDYPTGVGEFVLVEDCEKVTRQLQHVLEVEGCDYERLEVSSPGLDRPLKREADYARFCGESVTLTLKQPFQGQKKFTGVLQPAPAAEATKEPADAAVPTPAWRLLIGEAPPAKPGKGPKSGAAAKQHATGERALDFALAEVREARLTPVLDFKGRRFAPAPNTVPAEPVTGDREDGGREE